LIIIETAKGKMPPKKRALTEADENVRVMPQRAAKSAKTSDASNAPAPSGKPVVKRKKPVAKAKTAVKAKRAVKEKPAAKEKSATRQTPASKTKPAVDAKPAVLLERMSPTSTFYTVVRRPTTAASTCSTSSSGSASSSDGVTDLASDPVSEPSNKDESSKAAKPETLSLSEARRMAKGDVAANKEISGDPKKYLALCRPHFDAI